MSLSYYNLRDSPTRDAHHTPSQYHAAETDEQGGAPRVSLAHELAAAMMPEPTLTSQMLAEEFGLEFDDGDERLNDGYGQADGQDDEPAHLDSLGEGFPDRTSGDDGFRKIQTHGTSRPSADSRVTEPPSYSPPSPPSLDEGQVFGSHASVSSPSPEPPDSLELLARNLHSTDVLISQLRAVDTESASQSTTTPLESIAATIIGRLNDMSRQREQQVRELLECERELRRITAEVGGVDILGNLEELECVEGLLDPRDDTKEMTESDILHTPTASRTVKLGNGVVRSPLRAGSRRCTRRPSYDNDDLFTANNERDEDVDEVEPPEIHHPEKIVPTLSSSTKEMAYFRTLTQSLGASLTSLSEHAQVNGVNAADAGRKLRALKNKIVDLKADLDTAEKSRLKIQMLETGVAEPGDLSQVVSDPPPSGLAASLDSSRFTTTSRQTSSTYKRIDGRKLVEEQLQGFQAALALAVMETEAIMAR